MTKYLTRGAEYRDAFTVDWSEGMGYFHPSVGEVVRVIEKAKNERARGILLLLDWLGSEVVSIVERETEYWRLEEKVRTEFESPSWMESDTFRGWVEFSLRIYSMGDGRQQVKEFFIKGMF